MSPTSDMKDVTMPPTASSIPTPVLRALGRSVRRARLTAKMTQKDLATQVGVWRGTIANIERGSQNATIALLWLISEATDTAFDILFEDAADAMH